MLEYMKLPARKQRYFRICPLHEVHFRGAGEHTHSIAQEWAIAGKWPEQQRLCTNKERTTSWSGKQPRTVSRRAADSATLSFEYPDWKRAGEIGAEKKGGHYY